MSCGRTSATRPTNAGMTTSICDISPSWPAPPNVACMTRGERQEAEIGRPPRGRCKLPAAVSMASERMAPRSTGGLGLPHAFFWVAGELVGESIEEPDHPGAPLSKCGAGHDDISGTAEPRPLKCREHQIVAVARLGAGNERLLSEQSLKKIGRASCRERV